VTMTGIAFLLWLACVIAEPCGLVMAGQ
jgi:hypothetical protein